VSLEQRSKKELVELIHQLQDKVKELAKVEKQATAQLAELEHNAIGLTKDKDGYYYMVKIKYDVDKSAAMVDNVERIDSRDQAIVLYKLKQYAVETIMRKARGGKYDI
jgi:hypothetical protein